MNREDKIEDSNVSVRLKAVCKYRNIETIGQLVDAPISYFNNLGYKRTLAEINDIKIEMSK